MKENKNYRKTNIITYIFLALFILTVCSGFPLAFSLGGVFPFIMVLISLIMLFGLIYYHSTVNAYLCPNCHTKFKIGFLKDMCTPNSITKGKYLKCPHCGYRGWIEETNLE